MQYKPTYTQQKKINAIEVIVDSKYYNDHLIYRNPIKNEYTPETT